MIYKQIKRVKDVIQGKAPVKSTRSSKWPTVRKHFLEIPGNNICAACGGKDKIEVHHKMPYHLHPELELDVNNLISLCESKQINNLICHLVYGHLNNYKTFNPNVVEDAAASLKIITEALSETRCQ